jgi:hypothetical protein
MMKILIIHKIVKNLFFNFNFILTLEILYIKKESTDLSNYQK